MTSDMQGRIARLAADRVAGASEIVTEAVAILRDAISAHDDLLSIARAVCAAQPSMAPIWNAALAAVASVENPDLFTRFAHRLARAPEALIRFALEWFGTEPRTPLRLATISYSGSVALVIEALARTREVRVACSEGRPALEGRRMATRLAATGVSVTYFSDAAIGHALADCDAVLVGADAVAPAWFLNKSGTRMLAAAATQQGAPFHIVASRDKFVSDAVAGRLVPREGGADEVWGVAPSGVTVRNPYFEPTPLNLVASVITDAGVLGTGLVPRVCESIARETPAGLLETL